MRNPWRFSFDRTTGDLYIGDVGQAAYEEIDFQDAASPGGENYGWNILEGPACFSPPTGCVEPTGYAAPVYYYDHTVGRSVTGGYVYRGTKYPGLAGLYIYGDFVSGKIWGLRKKGALWTNTPLVDVNFSIATFGEDEEGNLYVGDFTNGSVYELKYMPTLAPIYELLFFD